MYKAGTILIHDESLAFKIQYDFSFPYGHILLCQTAPMSSLQAATVLNPMQLLKRVTGQTLPATIQFLTRQQPKQSKMQTTSYAPERYQLSSARIWGYSSQNWSPMMSQCRGTTLVLVRVTSTSFSSSSFGSFIFLVMTSLT